MFALETVTAEEVCNAMLKSLPSKHLLVLMEYRTVSYEKLVQEW